MTRHTPYVSDVYSPNIFDRFWFKAVDAVLNYGGLAVATGAGVAFGDFVLSGDLAYIKSSIAGMFAGVCAPVADGLLIGRSRQPLNYVGEQVFRNFFAAFTASYVRLVPDDIVFADAFTAALLLGVAAFSELDVVRKRKKLEVILSEKHSEPPS